MDPLSPETCTVGGLRGALFGVLGREWFMVPFISIGGGPGGMCWGEGRGSVVLGMVHVIVADAKVI